MLYNLARMTTPTTGTGAITLAAAVAGHLSFAGAGIPDGGRVRYAIIDGDNSEIGIGTYTHSGTTLSRDVIENSTNSGAAIDLSGSAQVVITPSGADFRLYRGHTLRPVAGSARDGGVADSQVIYPPNGVGYALGTGDSNGQATFTWSGFANTWNNGYNPSSFWPGSNFRSKIAVTERSGGSDTFRCFIGFGGNSIWGSSWEHGVILEYDPTAYSDHNLRFHTKASNTSTITDTGVAMPELSADDPPLDVTIELVSASLVKCFINGGLVATHTTNIPSNEAGQPWTTLLTKLSGTSPRWFIAFDPELELLRL